MRSLVRGRAPPSMGRHRFISPHACGGVPTHPNNPARCFQSAARSRSNREHRVFPPQRWRAWSSTPIENAVNGVKGLKTLRSKSVLGLSSVVLIFDEGAELMAARQLVQERLLTLTGQLPSLARTPGDFVAPGSSTSRVLKIGVWSQTLSQMEMTDLARWTIRPRLMSITGVANVAIWGQRDRHPGAGRSGAAAAARRAAGRGRAGRARRGALAGGGFVERPISAAVRQPVGIYERQTSGRNASISERSAAAAAGRGRRVESFPPPIGDAVINDVAGLLLIVEKQPWGTHST